MLHRPGDAEAAGAAGAPRSSSARRISPSVVDGSRPNRSRQKSVASSAESKVHERRTLSARIGGPAGAPQEAHECLERIEAPVMPRRRVAVHETVEETRRLGILGHVSERRAPAGRRDAQELAEHRLGILGMMERRETRDAVEPPVGERKLPRARRAHAAWMRARTQEGRATRRRRSGRGAAPAPRRARRGSRRPRRRRASARKA